MSADLLARGGTVVILVAAIAGLTVWYRSRTRADAARYDEAWPAVPADVIEPPTDGAGWVIFTTPVCASCRQVEAALHRDRPGDHVVLVDATVDPDLAERYEVRRAPTTLAVGGGGRVQARLVGVEDVLAHLLEPVG
jgi:hypothetical protein